MKLSNNSAVYASNKLVPLHSELEPVANGKAPVPKKEEELPGLLESEAHFVYDFTLEGSEVKRERKGGY